MRTSSVIDLFCGIGGMTHGFIKKGFKVIAGIDIDPSCKYAYEKNNAVRFILRDIEQMTANEVCALYPENDVKILIGCAPCQPFSTYVKGKTLDEKWKLLYKFGELVEGIRPDIVSMENVPGLIQYRKKGVFLDFIDLLEKNKYYFSCDSIFCPDYGIPQNRTRLVLIASKHGKIDFISKSHIPENYRTVKETISHLPPLEDGEVCETDIYHRTRKFSPLNKLRIANTPEGGSWKDWPEELLLDCHKKKSGKGYVSICGRMKWSEPAPTITTHCIGYGNGRFGHPEQNRAISLREAALLQTFPEYYEFAESEKELKMTSIARHIGNAVPVELGKAIARSIKNHLVEKGLT